MQTRKLTNPELIDLAIQWGLHWTGVDDAEAIEHFALAKRHAALSDVGLAGYNKRILDYSSQLQAAAAELPHAEQALALEHCARVLQLAKTERSPNHE